MEHSDDNETKTEYFSTTEYTGGDMYGYNNPTPAPPGEPSKRPGILTFICVLGFIGGVIGLLISFSSLMNLAPDWYRPFAILGVVVSTTGYIGVWNMKKWGMYILTLMYAVSMIVAYTMQQFSWPSMIGSGIILLVVIMNSGKME